MLRKINDTVVRPVKIETVPSDRIRGFSLFEQLYCNIFICSKKKTGKTSIIHTILKHCVGRNTKIVIISSTVDKDPTYLHIQKHFEEKGNVVVTFTSIREGKQDNLADILETLKRPAAKDDDTDDDEKEQPLNFLPIGSLHHNYDDRSKRKQRKEKLVAPEIIFVLDDLSTELRSPSVALLLKTHRHYKSKVIVSSQYPNDLLPESIRQMDYVILGPNHTDDKLEKIYRDLDLSVSFSNFYKIYKIATSKQFSFLYIDVADESFRVNFNQQFYLRDDRHSSQLP